MDIRKFLKFFLQLIHILVLIIVVFLPYFLTNKKYLLHILMFYIFLLFQWKTYDVCILSVANKILTENVIEEKSLEKYDNIIRSIEDFFMKFRYVDSKLIDDIPCLIILFNSVVIHYKLMK